VKYIKRIVIIISAAILFTCMAAQAEVIDKIIAVVNDDIITRSEFNTAFEPYLKRIEATYQGDDKDAAIKQTQAAFLQRLIDNLLIEQEAKKYKIDVKDEEIMTVLKESLSKQHLKMEDFIKKQEREGNTLASIKKDIKSQMMRVRLLRAEIKSKIIVSDQEIGDYYNQHRNDYEGKEAVRIKQILLNVPPKANKAIKAKIKKDAEKIHKRILDGEPFDRLAAKYSQGPGAQQGGDIGFFEKGSTIPELEAVAFTLPLGKVSPVIESGMGFHIIVVVDKRGAGIKPIEIVREEIKTKIEDEKLEKKYDEWISSLRKKSYIDIRL
jgi:peptidyl-prolyl cis-trans isomerase SurA